MLSIFSREKHKEHNPGVYWTLARRHFKVFFKNKLVLLFSLMVPLVTLIVYIIFLRPMELQQINNVLDNIFKGMSVTRNAYEKAYLFADAWMLSGIAATSCISVSLNTCQIMISDRERGVIKDFMSSPISRRSVNISYLIFNVLATLLVNACVLIISFIYLGAIGGIQISIGNALLFVPILILSVISASLITSFLISFITSGALFNSFTALISSAVGFLIGAFIPPNLFPAAAQKVTLFFPGTYSAGLFRTLYLKDYFINYKKYLIDVEHVDPTKVAEIEGELMKSFSFDIDFFGLKLNTGYMVLVLVIFIFIFAILNILFLDRNFVSSAHGKIKKKKKNK